MQVGDACRPRLYHAGWRKSSVEHRWRQRRARVIDDTDVVYRPTTFGDYRLRVWAWVLVEVNFAHFPWLQWSSTASMWFHGVVTDRHASVAWSVQLVYVLRSDSVLSTYDRSSAVDFPPFGWCDRWPPRWTYILIHHWSMWLNFTHTGHVIIF